MLRRLCLLLLMLGLALPAAAAPVHCAPVAVYSADHSVAHHGSSDAPIKQTAKHDCIGCIASYAMGAPPEAARLAPGTTQELLDDLLLPWRTARPDTPPPRA